MEEGTASAKVLRQEHSWGVFLRARGKTAGAELGEAMLG